MRRRGWSRSANGGVWLLNSIRGLPSCMGLTRGAGSWSRQTGPAVNGTTFIALGTSQNTPRFDQAEDGVEALLIEPTRTNLLRYSEILDAGGNDIPDNWTDTGAGATAGVDYNVIIGGSPSGGNYFQIENSMAVEQGGVDDVNGAHYLAGGVTAVASALIRRPTAGAQVDVYGFYLNPGQADITIPAGPFDWQRLMRIATTGGNCDYAYMAMCVKAAFPGQLQNCLSQLEVGDCATSVIIGAGPTSRAAELLTIDPSVVGRHRGTVEFPVRLDYVSTTALNSRHCLHAWAGGYELVYDPADDKVKMVVGGVDRSETAALAFAAKSWHSVRVDYSAAGTAITFDGTKTTNSTAWGDPGVLAPYLGSRAASALCKPAAFGRYASAWV